LVSIIIIIYTKCLTKSTKILFYFNIGIFNCVCIPPSRWCSTFDFFTS